MPLLLTLPEIRALAVGGHHLTQVDCDRANRMLCEGKTFDEVMQHLRREAETIEENWATELRNTSTSNLIAQMARYNRSGA